MIDLETKVLNIKLYEEDFNLIKIAIMVAIQNTSKHIDEPTLNQEDKDRLEKKIIEYKKLLSKLDICKLYNENDN